METFTTTTGMTFTKYDIKSDFMKELLPDESIKQNWGFWSPPDATHYHGLRTIYSGALGGHSLDVVHDRTCFSDTENTEFRELLNHYGYVFGTAEQATKHFRISGDADDRYYGKSECGKLECIFTPNSSFGYMYISFFTRS